MNRTQEQAIAPVARLAPPVQIGPATAADAWRISDFIAGLSVRTQFFRFFASVARPSSGLLRALTGADGRADILLAADRSGAVIGHGMTVDRAAPDGTLVSDVGLVIADDWQQRGIGSVLLSRLAERAASRGVTELVMDVLPANGPMLSMIGRRWPGARREARPDSVTFRAPLRGPGPAAAAA